MMARHALATLLPFMLLQACAGPGRTTVDTAPDVELWTVPLILQRLDLPTLPAALTAAGDLSIRSPLYTGGAAMRLKHRANDSMLVSLAVPGLGIEAARLLVTPDSFFLYNRLERSVTVGTEDLLPAMFNVAEAMRRMLGLIRPDGKKAWELVETADGLVLRDADRREQWIIDPALGRVLSYERRLPSGRLAEGLYFAEFVPVDGELYPKRVTYRNPVQSTNGLIHFRSLEFADEVSSMALGAPDGVTRIVVE